MKFSQLLDQPFLYFNSNKHKRIYIVSAAVFAQLFLLIFQPYGITEEMKNPVNTGLSKFLFFFSIAINTLIGLSLSQFVFRPLFNFQHVTIKKYAVWFFVEVLILTLLNFCFSFIIPDLGNDFETELSIGFQIQNYFKAFLVLLFPFFGTITYEWIERLNVEVNELGQQIKRYQSKFKTADKNQFLKLKDENDNLELSIALHHFLYAESSNQYVVVFYLQNNELKKHILRNRLKHFLNENEHFSIKQCHRSYVVNLLNVKHISRVDGKEYLVINKYDQELKVPISKSYTAAIKQEFFQ